MMTWSQPYPLSLSPCSQSSPEALASAVLAEIPQQLVDYMTKNHLRPPNPAYH